MGAKTRLAYWADIRHPQPLPTGDVEELSVPHPEAYHQSAALDTDPRLVHTIPATLQYGPEA
jgi:hypothetical protein